MPVRRALGIALLLLGLAPAPVARADGAAGETRVARLERQLLAAVNAYRRDAGLAPLRRDPTVAAVARRHSEAMARGAIPFGHDGLPERAAAIRASVPFRGLSENIARHSRPPDELVDATLRGWLASDRHRKNLRADRQLTGVGVAQSPRGPLYVTQIFIAVTPDAAGADP